MKILVVCQHYYPENFSITPICEELVRRGHKVDVVTGSSEAGYKNIRVVKEETIRGVHVFRVKTKPRAGGLLNLFKNYVSFWSNSKKFVSVTKEEYDVVYSMSLSPVISVVAANKYAKKHKVKHVLHVLDLWPESPVAVHVIKKKSLWYKLLFRWSKKIYLNTDEILVSSPSFVNYFSDVLGIENKEIKFVAQPAISPEPNGPKTFDKKYNLIYAGNIGVVQKIDEFVKAISLLKDKNDFQFHIFGSGTYGDKVKSLINELNLGEYVVMHGVVTPEELAGYYKESTAIVVPLESDGSWVSSTIPNKLVTAMSYGRPILASISGDGEKILKETQGSFFTKLESSSIAETMKNIIATNPDVLDAMGKRNKAYYDSHFDFNMIIDQLETELSSPKN